MRVAAIDIGTNTVLLTIAEVHGRAPKPLLERAVITRLGQGVDRTGRLSTSAIARTLESLSEYGRLMVEYGVERFDAVCTSAARDASNANDFLRGAHAALGATPRVIAGTEEARLTFLGARVGLDVSTRTVGVFDVGGGSTEFIVGRLGTELELDHIASLDVGSVRLTERFLCGDPPTPAEITQAMHAVEQALDAAPSLHGIELIGVAGTVTTLKALELELEPYDPDQVHGARLTAQSVSDRLDRLCRLTSSERARLPGLEPGRADVIVAGAVIVRAVLRHASTDACTVSDRGVRWGLVQQLLASPGTAPPVFQR